MTGQTATNKVYNANTVATLAGGSVAAGVIGGDAVTLTNGTGSFADKNVGAAKAVTVTGTALVGTDAGNYTVANPTGLTANITAASIANVGGITAANKVQDGNTSATLALAGATFTGLLASDVLTVGSAVGNFDSAAVGNGKAVNITGITLSGADAGNYTLTNSTAVTTANITPAPVVVSAASIASTPAVLSLARNLSGVALTQFSGGSIFRTSLPALAIIGAVRDNSSSGANSGGLPVQTLREPTDSAIGLFTVALVGNPGDQAPSFVLPASLRLWAQASQQPVEVSLPGGAALPSWLRYDASTQIFTTSAPPAGALPLEIRVTIGNRSALITISDAQVPDNQGPRTVVQRPPQVPAPLPG